LQLVKRKQVLEAVVGSRQLGQTGSKLLYAVQASQIVVAEEYDLYKTHLDICREYKATILSKLSGINRSTWAQLGPA
jgi:hypothetical protein